MIGKTLGVDRRRLSHERRGPIAVHGRTGSATHTSYLSRVLREVAELMRADGGLFTLHSHGSDTPGLIFADEDLPEATCTAMLEMLTQGVRLPFEDGQCFWREDVGRHGSAVFLMPVDQAEGHGRLVISLYFARAGKLDRSEVERLFHQRRPFATGFFQLWQQNRLLEHRGVLLESVLDRTAIGLVMLDGSGRIAFANQTADEILREGDGIGRSNGMLRASNLSDGVNLQAALSHALASHPGQGPRLADRAPLLAFQRRKGPPLVAAFLPALTSPVEQQDVAAVMYLVDPQIDTARMLSPLCKLYALSPVETALVCHLAAGETISSTALKMHIKDQTARGYLKTIFIKTGTKRQTELVVLMLSSLIRMRRDVMQEALTVHHSERALQWHASA